MLIKIRDELKTFFVYDPVLQHLEKIFLDSVYEPSNIKAYDELVKEAEKRFKNNIPPGLTTLYGLTYWKLIQM